MNAAALDRMETCCRTNRLSRSGLRGYQRMPSRANHLKRALLNVCKPSCTLSEKKRKKNKPKRDCSELRRRGSRSFGNEATLRDLTLPHTTFDGRNNVNKRFTNITCATDKMSENKRLIDTRIKYCHCSFPTSTCFLLIKEHATLLLWTQ